MAVIKKVLNTSVILANDGTSEDYIILQKGIGFGRKPNEIVEPDKDCQVFVLKSENELSKLTELLSNIPVEFFEIAKDIVSYGQKQLHRNLNEHIYLALTDHIHFAVERINQNIVLTNRLFWEVKTFYPKEYEIGLYGLKLIKDRLDIVLPEEEAANIAFHIVNGQSDNPGTDALRNADFISKMSSIVTYTMKIEYNSDSIHYSRFFTHLQFFVERFFSDTLLESNDDFLFYNMEEKYPKAIMCAERIRTMLIQKYGRNIPNEEVAYLAVHINRLAERKD